MYENYPLPAGFTAVSDINALATSGARNSVFFAEGQTIQIGDGAPCSAVRTSRDGKPVTDKAGKPILVYYLACSVDGAEPRPIPFGAFRRFPKDAEAFLAQSELMRRLYSGTDLDRYNLLKGKRLKVAKLVPGLALDFDKSDLDTRTFVYKDAKFPIFEISE